MCHASECHCFYRLKNIPCECIFCLHTLYICISGYLHYFYHVAIMTNEFIIYNFQNKRSPSPLRRLSDIHWEDEAYIYIYIAKNISLTVA